MTIAEIFKAIRLAHGLSQIKMAEMLDTTQGTISNIEKGVNANPTYEIIKKLIFNVGANPLFVFGIDNGVAPVMHPTVLKDKLKGHGSTTLQEKTIRDIEHSLNVLKSIKN